MVASVKESNLESERKKMPKLAKFRVTQREQEIEPRADEAASAEL